MVVLRRLVVVAMALFAVLLGGAGAATQANPTLTIIVQFKGQGTSGTVTSSPSGINTANGNNQLSVRSGTAVTLTATPGGGTTGGPVYFGGWFASNGSSLIGDCIGGGANPCTITITGDRTIVVKFVNRDSILAAVGTTGEYAASVPSCLDDAPVGYRLACGPITKGDSGAGLNGAIAESAGRLHYLSGSNLWTLDTDEVTFAVGSWDVAPGNGNLAWALQGGADAPIKQLTGNQLRAGNFSDIQIADNLLGQGGSGMNVCHGVPGDPDYVCGPNLWFPFSLRWNNDGSLLALVGKRSSDRYCDPFGGSRLCVWTVRPGSNTAYPGAMMDTSGAWNAVYIIDAVLPTWQADGTYVFGPASAGWKVFRPQEACSTLTQVDPCSLASITVGNAWVPIGAPIPNTSPLESLNAFDCAGSRGIFIRTQLSTCELKLALSGTLPELWKGELKVDQTGDHLLAFLFQGDVWVLNPDGGVNVTEGRYQVTDFEWYDNDLYIAGAPRDSQGVLGRPGLFRFDAPRGGLGSPPPGAPPTEATYGPCENPRYENVTRVQQACAMVADPVNLATGAVTSSVTDVEMASLGERFEFTRSYTSLDTESGELGVGWTDSYAHSLSIDTDSATWRAGSGAQTIFTRETDGSYTSPEWSLAKLTSAGSGHEVVTAHQVHYLFDAQGRLTDVRDRNGQGVTISYGTDGLGPH